MSLTFIFSELNLFKRRSFLLTHPVVFTSLLAARILIVLYDFLYHFSCSNCCYFFRFFRHFELSSSINKGLKERELNTILLQGKEDAQESEPPSDDSEVSLDKASFRRFVACVQTIPLFGGGGVIVSIFLVYSGRGYSYESFIPFQSAIL